MKYILEYIYYTVLKINDMIFTQSKHTSLKAFTPIANIKSLDDDKISYRFLI